MTDWLNRAAASRPDAPALIDRDRSLTYGELFEEATAAALELRSRGFGARAADRDRPAARASHFAVAFHAGAAGGEGSPGS